MRHRSAQVGHAAAGFLRADVEGVSTGLGDKQVARRRASGEEVLGGGKDGGAGLQLRGVLGGGEADGRG